MKVTFPRKKNIKTAGDKAVYVVLGRGGRESSNDKFWVMDFWGKPYTFRTYIEAVSGAKTIKKQMEKYKWFSPETAIAKVVI